MYRFIHIVLEIGNSSAAAQKLGMSTSGVVDIPFLRSVRDALLAEGLAEEHRWVSNSGWITFQMRGEADLGHALWLMRLSHLRYALKTSTDPQKLFAQESEELHLNTISNRCSNHMFQRLLSKFRLSQSQHWVIAESRRIPPNRELPKERASWLPEFSWF
jgi:hypothetical protein